jgi:hypothetical protein
MPAEGLLHVAGDFLALSLDAADFEDEWDKSWNRNQSWPTVSPNWLRSRAAVAFQAI